MLDVRSLLQSYTQYWWSPLPGEAYVMPWGNDIIGPGRIALSSPGLFNIYWLLSRLPEPTNPLFRQKFLGSIWMYAELQKIGKLKVQDISVSEWATLMKPQEFAIWLNFNYIHLTPFPSIRLFESADIFRAAVEKAVATHH